MILESTLLCCRCITCTEISSGWDFPNGKTTLEQNKLCLKLHLIGYKSKKSPPSLCGCIFLDEKPHAAGILRWFYARELQRRQCSLRICFLEAFGKSRVFSPKSWHGPELFFIWFEIYFTRQSMWYGPSGKSGPALCLFSAPSSSLCTFPGNCHDESAERGNLSMDQKFWEAFESEVQLHRQRHGECEAQVLMGEKKARKFIFPPQLLCFCDRGEKYSAHIT